MRRLTPLVLAFALALATPADAAPKGRPPVTTAAPSLAALHAGQVVAGFTAVARYRGARGAALGGRFVHQASGFTFDLLGIQSVPQAFVWVSSWPTSDKGEPHTQEHLLLGKGNRGRFVATLDSMSLTDTSAYTEQRRTVYQLATAAGLPVYWQLVEARLDALLHPDYTDEEVRREVRNFGVKAGDKGLELEEQGTVYNEMQSTYERPWSLVYRELARALHGPAHPLSFDAGGSPEALRVLTPADIRHFHGANYHLARMGMIASLPPDLPLAQALSQLDGILRRVEPDAARYVGHAPTDRDLPPSKGAAPGTVTIVGYPEANAEAAGHLLVGWQPATTFADPQDRLLADLFAGAFAGDATTTLYKRFIDSKTRSEDLGATGVYASFSDEPGHAFVVAFSDMAARHLDQAAIARVRGGIREALATISAWPAGSPELTDFDARVLALLTETRRGLAKFVNSPPGFGFRSTYSGWFNHLEGLAEAGGFERSVTLERDLAAVEKALKGPQNLWGPRLKAWGLLGAEPIAVAVKPDPGLAAQERAAREARLSAEAERLKGLHKAKDAQAGLASYRTAFEAETARLKQLEAASSARRFLEAPPLSRDPGLAWREARLDRDVPLVASTFENMSGATVGLAVRLDAVPDAGLPWLALLPSLLTEVGASVDGKPLSHEEVTRRLRTEVLGVDAYFDRNARTKRCELVLRGAGNTPAEAARAIAWMRRMAYAPDWRPANLPRIRDVVTQAGSGLRQRMKGPEERWVRDPAGAFRRQDDPVQLATGSFLTREHLAHRLRWRLADPGTPDEGRALTGFLTELSLAPKTHDRKALQALLATLSADKPVATEVAALPEAKRPLAIDAARDLAHYLPDLPDGSLAADWAALCHQMQVDLGVPPEQALKELQAVRKAVFQAPGARMFMIGAKATQTQLLTRHVPQLLRHLGAGLPAVVRPAGRAYVSERALGRLPGAAPRFVGLLAPNTQSGVFVNTAGGTSYRDLDRESLLKYLASKLYAGGGAHSIFMKTWGAGLAYSNGLSGSPESGELAYYAERCPELPQTLGFVIGELKGAKPDPALVEYAFALAFDDSRAAWAYESRGEAIAQDLADGVKPAAVQQFREALLKLRAEPKLVDELFKRMPEVYGTVLPGLHQKASAVPDATYFVIGPETQMAAWEAYLKTHEGAGTTLTRLHPRDFWLPVS